MKIKTIAAAAAVIFLPASVTACSKDSEKSMNDTMAMEETDVQTDASATKAAHGFGTIISVDQEARKVTISHDAIPEIGWGAMTMAFAVDERIAISSIYVGDNLHFMLESAGEGAYRIAMACRIEGDMEAHKAAMRSMMEGMADGDMMMGMDIQGGAVMPCTLDPR